MAPAMTVTPADCKLQNPITKMANSRSYPGHFLPEGHILMPELAEYRSSDFTIARDAWREVVDVIKSFRQPGVRSPFSFSLMGRAEACLARMREHWGVMAQVNPTCPLLCALIFVTVVLCLRA